MSGRLWTWLLLSAFLAAALWLASPFSRSGKKVDIAPLPNRAASISSQTSHFDWPLSNTPLGVGELALLDSAILLENALLDTASGTELPIPPSLKAQSNPGAYILQTRGPNPAAAKTLISGLDAEIVCYIPNNAWLIRSSDATIAAIASAPEILALLPYQPYFKLDKSLLPLALTPQGPPVQLNVLLFPDPEGQGQEQIAWPADVKVLLQDRSPFGPLLKLSCNASSLATLASLPQVAAIEPAHKRVPANDLTRQTLGIAGNATTHENYLGLTGTNVLVGLTDTGVDDTHPDLVGRVLFSESSGSSDPLGHGTLVAGIIAGSGTASSSVSKVQGSIMPPVPYQFRGSAPGASLFAVKIQPDDPLASDSWLQETLARTNVFISNNSWIYANSTEYDLSAASFDAAVRDSLPDLSGSQPVLFVFSAGNSGDGSDDGTGGTPGTIQSPGTAKNVITVGAVEQRRHLTNLVCGSQPTWFSSTDSSNQVASFSARGNVGIGIEGPFGRMKPDVVAPGVFLVAPRASDWDQIAYYDPSNLPGCPGQGPALSNLNNSIGSSLYRYESGTSLSAGAVAGTLALMQQFFTERLERTNSPALLKALLINGARQVPGPRAYPSTETNLQGWGLVQIPNSLPTGFTNFGAAPMLFFDQDPFRAVATGQKFDSTLAVAESARLLPLRFTLVWTDPPANPVAGIKLVNDLDLVVTNLETGEVFFGNDLDSETGLSRPVGASPVRDFVNNVENIFLPPGLGSNYAVSVVGRRVNVKAVSNADLAAVAQDFALVISCGDGGSANALQILQQPSTPALPPTLSILTNTFSREGQTGAFVYSERIGEHPPASEPLAPMPGDDNQAIWIGSSNQWRFFVLTNTAGFTNAAFFTFTAPMLSTGPFGQGETNSNLGREEADIDLYVSTDPALVELDANALSSSIKSQDRSGLEAVSITDAVPEAYYVAVKCESQGAAQFGFLGVFSELPFSTSDFSGTEFVRGVPLPVEVPGTTGTALGRANVLALASEPGILRKLVVTNAFTSTHLGDIAVTLRHKGTTVLLKDRSNEGSTTNQIFIWDDSSEMSLPSALPTDGPGSLLDFCGKPGRGPWLLSLQSSNNPATVDDFGIELQYQQDLLFGSISAVLPGACRDEYVELPLETTNLTLMFGLLSGDGPVEIQIAPVESPIEYIQQVVLNTAMSNQVVTIDAGSNPPLAPGNYRVQLCNGGDNSAQVQTVASHILGPKTPAPVEFSARPSRPITDDALTTETMVVTNGGPIFSLEAGVRIRHPRISDLAIALKSPQGTRVMLWENRGAGSTNGLGAEISVTNIVPVSSSGGPKAYTNAIDIGRTWGLLKIDYDFYALPDFMRVYYENELLFDSGLVSGAGSTNLQFGPGASTVVTIVMNEGDNYDPDTAWFYSVSSTRQEPLYLTFTENSNLASGPVKFALPPFHKPVVPGANGIFYLPESTLERFKGELSTGEWTLEIRDVRPGGVDPVPILKSWQLAFVHSNPTPIPIALSHGQTLTNSLGPGRIQWMQIQTPAWATFATNTLLWSSLPVRLLFNVAELPTGTNSGDHILLAGAVSGIATLGTNSSPPLAPGNGYYLGVQNTNDSSVDFAFRLDFDVTPLENSVALTDDLGKVSRYFSFDVSTHATAVEFKLFGLNGEADLVINQGLPFPVSEDCLVGSFNPGIDQESIVLFEDSSPVALVPGNWFIGVVGSANAGSYTLKVTEYTNAWPQITELYSGGPFYMSPGQGGIEDYYRFLVSTNAVRVQFEVLSPTAEVALVARRGLPLPTASDFDLISANPGRNNELIVINRDGSPAQLVPGDWFLSVLSLSGEPAGYVVQATKFDSVPPVRFTHWEILGDSFCLTWASVSGGHYFVQANESLSDTNWVTLTETLTAVDVQTSWCLPLPSPYQFFRLCEGIVLTPSPEESFIRAISPSEAGFRLEWTAPTNFVYYVQWGTPALYPSWTTFTNSVTSSTGRFTFTDDGSQSGGFGTSRLYRFFRPAGR